MGAMLIRPVAIADLDTILKLQTSALRILSAGYNGEQIELLVRSQGNARAEGDEMGYVAIVKGSQEKIRPRISLAFYWAWEQLMQAQPIHWDSGKPLVMLVFHRGWAKLMRLRTYR
jgi:hypothetical protein